MIDPSRHCAKCGVHDPSGFYKWQVCAMSGEVDLCQSCDIELNEIGVKWLYPKSWRRLMKNYRKQLRADP